LLCALLYGVCLASHHLFDCSLTAWNSNSKFLSALLCKQSNSFCAITSCPTAFRSCSTILSVFQHSCFVWITPECPNFCGFDSRICKNEESGDVSLAASFPNKWANYQKLSHIPPNLTVPASYQTSTIPWALTRKLTLLVLLHRDFNGNHQSFLMWDLCNSLLMQSLASQSSSKHAEKHHMRGETKLWHQKNSALQQQEICYMCFFLSISHLLVSCPSLPSLPEVLGMFDLLLTLLTCCRQKISLLQHS
jgi:hypothetical protein